MERDKGLENEVKKQAATGWP